MGKLSQIVPFFSDFLPFPIKFTFLFYAFPKMFFWQFLTIPHFPHFPPFFHFPHISQAPAAGRLIRLQLTRKPLVFIHFHYSCPSSQALGLQTLQVRQWGRVAPP